MLECLKLPPCKGKMVYFKSSCALLIILVVLPVGSLQELKDDTSHSRSHSLDKTSEGKTENSSITRSVPTSSLTNYNDDEDEDNNDEGEGEDDGDVSGRGQDEATLSTVHKKEAPKATIPEVGSGENQENDEGEEEDEEKSYEGDEEHNSISGSTIHSTTQYSLDDDETQEDNEFPDDDEEDVDEDESTPIGMPPSSYSPVRSNNQMQEFASFQEDEDERNENEAGSTGEFSGFSRGSDADLTAKDVSRLLFSGDENPLSYTASRKASRRNKTAEFSKKKQSNNTSAFHSQKAVEKLKNTSNTEQLHDVTAKLQNHTVKHAKLNKANVTVNDTLHKQKLHGNSTQGRNHSIARGHPGVKSVSGKIRGKAVITVVSHSFKKRIKGRFQVPQEKFLGRGVSVMASSLKRNGNATVAHSLVRQKCHVNDILEGHSLKGGTKAGHVDILGETAGMQACIKRCCHARACDVALRVDGKCYGVACYSKELCEGIPVPHPYYVQTQLAFMDKANKKDQLGDEIHCKYGNVTLRNDERWSGELCGGVVVCKDGVATVNKCPGIPPKPKNCYSPKLKIKHRKGKCCKMRWNCQGKNCVFGGRMVKHGYSLSDPLCTGVVQCFNGKLEMQFCPKIPDKPTDCARPRLKIVTRPGQCCKKHWVCSDKSCKYDKLKLAHGEKATDASCAVVMTCKNGFLSSKPCPSPPLIPTACINPSLDITRIPGKCCKMSWKCAMT